MINIPHARLFYPTGYEIAETPLSAKCGSPQFATHQRLLPKILYSTSKLLQMPGYFCMRMAAHLFEPLPGADKDSTIWKTTVRVSALVACSLMILVAKGFLILSYLTGFVLDGLAFKDRPAFGYIHPEPFMQWDPQMASPKDTLHIRTHNLAMVGPWASILGELRHPRERAEELVQSIVTDPHPPDILCFQEAFCMKETICNGIRFRYPYILHTIAPSITGFDSGLMIASKYPIESMAFYKLGHMLGPERLTPRGVLKVIVNVHGKRVEIFNTHTQAFHMKKRAEARAKQLKNIVAIMKAHVKSGIPQVLVGDLNTSRITIWGEDNSYLSENIVLKILNKHFQDPFLEDHDPVTGIRIRGKPWFLKEDNTRLNARLPEPSGSWITGPYQENMVFMRVVLQDRLKHRFALPPKVKDIPPSGWGTKQWKQGAYGHRLDYILFPKGQNTSAFAEIRRTYLPEHAQSAFSDHWPVDAVIQLS